MEDILVGFVLSLLTIFAVYSIFRMPNTMCRILRVFSILVIIIMVDSLKLFEINDYAVFSIILMFFIEILFFQSGAKRNKERPPIPGNEEIDIRFYSTPMFMTKIMIILIVLMYGDAAYPGNTEMPGHVYVFLSLPLLMLVADGIIYAVKKKKYSGLDNYFENNRLRRLDHGASFIISALMMGFCVFSAVADIEFFSIVFLVAAILSGINFFKHLGRERAFRRLLSGKVRHTHYSLRFAYGKLKNLDWKEPEKKEGLIARTKRKTTDTVKQGTEKVKQGFSGSKEKLSSLFHKKQ